MSVMIFVLAGFVAVSAASVTADWCKAQFPALFGLVPATQTARQLSDDR